MNTRRFHRAESVTGFKLSGFKLADTGFKLVDMGFKLNLTDGENPADTAPFRPMPLTTDLSLRRMLQKGFKKYPAQKDCLSFVLEPRQVEKVVKIHDFRLNPLCKLHREISEFHHFFNLWDLYLRAQTRFFIRICF